MDKSQVDIIIKTPGGNMRRTLSDHTDLDDLKDKVVKLFDEVDDVIKAGEDIKVLCCSSDCKCSDIFRSCFRPKVKASVTPAIAVDLEAKDVKLTAV